MSPGWDNEGIGTLSAAGVCPGVTAVSLELAVAVELLTVNGVGR